MTSVGGLTFLQLVARLAQECAVPGTISTLQNASGQTLRLANWIQQAWTEIQTRHEWDWMRSSNLRGAGVSFATVDLQATYPLGTGTGTVGIAAADFGSWYRHAFRNYPTASGQTSEVRMDFIPYDTWRDDYQYGAQRSVDTRPIVVAIGPDQSLCLGPTPNGDYTITGDYYVAPSGLSLDTDTPSGLPNRFHLMIVYAAMMSYGAYESAPEVYQRGSAKFTELMRQLEWQYLPEMTFAGALA